MPYHTAAPEYLTPAQFVAKWQAVQLPERAASQEHFLDICRMLGQTTQAERPGRHEAPIDAYRQLGRAGYRQVYTFEDDHRVVADLSANGWRLPTVTEWTTAAQSGEAAEITIDPTKTNYGLHYRGTTAVGRFLPFPPSERPVYDILGNVTQWCQDADIGRLSHRSFKGASWMDHPKHLRMDTTGSLPPENTNPDFGFRCVRVPFGEEDT